MTSLASALDEHLWPLVDDLVTRMGLAGLAVAVVRGEEVAMRGFGVRDVRTGEPVTPETMFHLASVSKPFVATAVMALAARGELDLDAPLTDHVPEFSLADGRAAEVTARGLLSHTSGLGDVTDYYWHEPQLGDEALSDFARSLSGWRLTFDPGTKSSYSNAGYELLGLLVSRVAGTTFEQAMTDLVLAPAGMPRSTFLRADVPAELAASPHVGRPLVVPGDAYPYTRRHAPSSTLHSNLVEMSRWIHAVSDATVLDSEWAEQMAAPVRPLDDPPWEEAVTLAWALGTWRGHRAVSHSGMDPGFRSLLTILPDDRAGVVVLGNSNTIPAYAITEAAYDVAISPSDGKPLAELSSMLPPVAVPVSAVLASDGPAAAVEEFHRLATADPLAVDLEWDGFDDSVWGGIELHRTDLVWPLLRLWTEVRPDSVDAWAMTGWAHSIDGEPDLARTALERALSLDPSNEDAGTLLAGLTS